MLIVLLTITLCALSSPAAAAGTGNDAPSLAMAMIKMFFALIMVIGLILLALHGAKRLKVLQERTTGANIIKVLATKVLAPRKYVSVIEVGGEIVVVGMSESSINVLTKMEKQKIIEDINSCDGQGGSGEKRVFSQLLKRYQGNRETRPW